MLLFQENGDYENLKWFRRTISDGITRLSKKIWNPWDVLTERQGFAGPFFVPLIIGSILFLGKISLIKTRLVFLGVRSSK